MIQQIRLRDHRTYTVGVVHNDSVGRIDRIERNDRIVERTFDPYKNKVKSEKYAICYIVYGKMGNIEIHQKNVLEVVTKNEINQ